MTADSLDFDDHPWPYRDAADAGYDRAYGLRAVDGDTIDVRVDPGYRQRPKVRIRLRGIDTPEIYGVESESDEYEAGKRAQERVRELILRRPLLLYSGDDTGRYGRWLSDVRVEIGETTDDGVDLADLLAEEGLAEV